MSLMTGRSGRIYIPPFKLARVKEELVGLNSVDAQRLEWETLRKSVKGLINRVSTTNLKDCVQELFVENLVWGRGLVVRFISQAQTVSPVFTPVFAALIAVVNSKLPDIGNLLLRRIILQFRRAYMRSDEMQLRGLCRLIAHLFNQRVISEMVILQLVTIFLENLTNDSVKLSCLLLSECGEVLTKVSPKGVYLVFERLRVILQEGEIDKRVQYLVESLFEARRAKFAGNPGIGFGLDLVEEADQITHEVDLIDGDIDGEDELNVFTPMDPLEFAAQAEEWRQISAEMLGLDEEEEEEEEEEEVKPASLITDMTDQDLINLRRTIYLAIQSSANYEECVHKILGLRLRSGQEKEVCQMLIDCCAMEKTSNKFFAFQAERLARLNRSYRLLFEQTFVEQYECMHEYEIGKIRNLAKFFGYLLSVDAIRWDVLGHVELTEEATSSSTRIFLKILFQDLNEELGSAALLARVGAAETIFPQHDIGAMRFSINFFTAINLGPLTAGMRARLTELVDKTKSEVDRKRAKSESSDEGRDGSGRADRHDEHEDRDRPARAERGEREDGDRSVKNHRHDEREDRDRPVRADRRDKYEDRGRSVKTDRHDEHEDRERPVRAERRDQHEDRAIHVGADRRHYRDRAHEDRDRLDRMRRDRRNDEVKSEDGSPRDRRRDEDRRRDDRHEDRRYRSDKDERRVRQRYESPPKAYR